ncbi:MAG: glycosyl transferase, partial [Planctomycetota bacterium]
MKQSITDFLTNEPIVKRALRAAQKGFSAVYRRLPRKWDCERLFFPTDFGKPPPPAATVPSGTEEIPRSPIDGKPAERLLFTTPDTRFGERELNYIYLDERHGIAITHPHIAADK